MAIAHDYYCTECETIREVWVDSKDLNKPVLCPDDGQEMVRLFIKAPAMKMASGGTRRNGIR